MPSALPLRPLHWVHSLLCFLGPSQLHFAPIARSLAGAQMNAQTGRGKHYPSIATLLWRSSLTTRQPPEPCVPTAAAIGQSPRRRQPIRQRFSAPVSRTPLPHFFRSTFCPQFWTPLIHFSSISCLLFFNLQFTSSLFAVAALVWHLHFLWLHERFTINFACSENYKWFELSF